MVYALWFEDPQQRTHFKRFLRVTDDVNISFYRDCDIFLPADQIERYILRIRELEFMQQVLNEPKTDYNKVLKFKDYGKCA